MASYQYTAKAREKHLACQFARQQSPRSDTSTGFPDTPSQTRQCSGMDTKVSPARVGKLVEKVLLAMSDDWDFCVTISDPRLPDCPLIAVSNHFEEMTGYSRSEVLGKNCRFLNTSYNLEFDEVMALRESCKTGDPFRGVLRNRRKSGEVFLNFLDLQALTIAQNSCTDEKLWFLLGIQADVSVLCEAEQPTNRTASLHTVADAIRTKLTHELWLDAMNDTTTPSCSLNSKDEWCILDDLIWSGSMHSESSDEGTTATDKVEAPQSMCGSWGAASNMPLVMTALATSGQSGDPGTAAKDNRSFLMLALGAAVLLCSVYLSK